MHPNVNPLDDDPGLAIYDPIENVRFVLFADRDVAPTPTDQDRLAFPVGTAVSIRAGTLVLPKRDSVHVRTIDGEHLDMFPGDVAGRYRADGARLLDVTSSAMKLYLAIPGPFEIVRDDDERALEIRLGTAGEVVVGVRSFHERPAATIETPPEPESVMRALGASGSALKTMTCERSYPTLRGHPPAFERAEELSIPASLDPPDTDIRIRVPPSWEYVFPVAPLVFYLGASLRPGGTPRLEVGSWSFPLAGTDEGPAAFTDRVHRALQQVFFLDCLTRTEGLYRIDLDERQTLRDELDLDFAALYDRPVERQVRSYLDVPYSAVEDHLPSWHLCVDVQPSAEHVEALPYVLDDLALVRCPRPREPAELDEEMDEAITAFVRDPGGAAPGESGPGERSPRRDVPSLEEEVFSPRQAPTTEHAYLGDGLPLRQNKMTIDSLRRRLEYDVPERASISVKIVCNDQGMADEASVEEFYGVHDLVQYSVDVEYELTREQLADAFHEEVELLHYIGHNDEDGFECTDGQLDARDLDGVGVDTFLLNACTSYEQGQALIDGGAKAGVASLSLVSNAAANRFGRTMARALNAGFTLRSALSLTEFTTSATQYLVLGDGGRQLAQAESGIPCLVEIVDADVEAEKTTVELFAYPASGYRQGTFWSPALGEPSTNYLVFGHVDQYELGVEQMFDLLSVQSYPILADGQLRWSNELDRETFLDLLSEIENRPIRNSRDRW